MKKIIVVIVSLTMLSILSGCGTGGAFQANHVTNVMLSEPNFNIVARDVNGSAMQGYLIGLSFSQGSEVGSFGLVKISGVDAPYNTAIKNLWENFEKEYGKVAGKKLALINVRHDSELLNTIVYTQAKYFITADVVEFIE